METHVQENKAAALIPGIYDIVGSNGRYWLKFANFAMQCHLQEQCVHQQNMGKGNR
jgi:hypothetical protein